MHLLTNAVDGFVRGWNAHPISTEHNFTPIQLFVLGLMRLKNSGVEHEELNQGNMVNRMAEREAHILADLSYSSRRVLVPPIQSPLSEEKLDFLKKQLQPLFDNFAKLTDQLLVS